MTAWNAGGEQLALLASAPGGSQRAYITLTS